MYFMIVLDFLKLSRPRYWFYLVGPYLITYTMGMPTLPWILHANFITHAFFFLIPGNIYLYAIESLHLDMTPHRNKKEKKLFFLVLTAALCSTILLLSYETSSTIRVDRK